MYSLGSNIVEFESAQLESTDLTEIIEEDKRYGTFQPFNGEYYTYRVLNEDKEITNKQVLKSIEYSYSHEKYFVYIKEATQVLWRSGHDLATWTHYS